ncbi:acetyl esterase [Skermanella aerolata]|uniref:Acetyl esterase n=1 Tax=Skermanella aerolata TaxID=393310 RepID=A0A512DX88_9PROT|nr:alpha/beta hydrolase fold domain-containing protein [Skermanella aerolata]KJB93544.1 acetyl esterase [Skermanella aerolata KACC 11604]GEO41079.1 acetyl esterase [Skermanella aerolata]
MTPLPDDELASGVSEALAISAGPVPAASDDVAAMRSAYEAGRARWNEPVIDLASVTNDVLRLDRCSMGVRVYRPSSDPALPALVYLHGGGFVVGSLDSHDRIMRQLCRRSGMVVVGVDYPLSPEHRHPEAVVAVEQAVLALAEAPLAYGIDPERVSIGGDSAGAHLALAATLRLRERRPGLIRFMLLYYGLYGLRDSASRRRFADDAYGLTPAELRFYDTCYRGVGADPESAASDLLSCELAGLPPAFIGAAALDPLLDDSLALADAVARARGRAELCIYDGVLHGFLHWSRLVPTAAEALEDGARALRAALLKPPS